MEDILEHFRPFLKDYLGRVSKKSSGTNMWNCPICGSGTGKNGTGAMKYYPKDERVHCHKCGFKGDVLDVIGECEGIPDFMGRAKRASELFGVPLPASSKPSFVGSPKKEEPKEEADFLGYYAECQQRLHMTDYWRGISEKTLKRFGVGFDPAWVHPKGKGKKGVQPTPRLIVPVGAQNYLARYAGNESIPDGLKKMKVRTEGEERLSWLFNVAALEQKEFPVCVVEGEIDAMSLEDIGAPAVALGSISNVNRFLETVEKNPPKKPLILALDNDGKETTLEKVKALEQGLRARNITFCTAEGNALYGESKDANEALNKDREALADNVVAMWNKAYEALEEEKRAYLKNSVASHIEEFRNGIAASASVSAIPTGFAAIDRALDGGIYPGLYAIGAISSLGKTTLVMQIADNIAGSGTDVLIFSLEMSRAELMAKSISRFTAVIGEENNNYLRQHFKTARGILDGKRYEKYEEGDRNLIKEAIAAYSLPGKHLFISEGIGDIGVEHVRATVEKHVRITGNVPVVIVDYLQILAPYNERFTDKQNTDKAVLELKRLSRDFKTPVLAVSSFNRDNYTASVTMEAFKESGAIEYSADVLLGLQLQIASDWVTTESKGNKGMRNEEVLNAKKADPREVQLVVLKNRYGAVGEKINMTYYPLFNLYKEA